MRQRIVATRRKGALRVVRPSVPVKSAPRQLAGKLLVGAEVEGWERSRVAGITVYDILDEKKMDLPAAR